MRLGLHIGPVMASVLGREHWSVPAAEVPRPVGDVVFERVHPVHFENVWDDGPPPGQPIQVVDIDDLTGTVTFAEAKTVP